MPQQQPQGRTARTLSTARLVRGAALAGGLAILPLVTACSGSEGGAAAENRAAKVAAPAAGVVAPAKIEVIANLTGCKAEIRVEAEELRDGYCHTKKGSYLITTFPQEKYKLTWLDATSMYGGKYLVGPRWVVSAPEKMLEPLRTKLGGTVQQLRGTGPAPASPVPSSS